VDSRRDAYLSPPCKLQTWGIFCQVKSVVAGASSGAASDISDSVGYQ